MPRLPVRVLRRAFGASTSNMLQDNRLNRFAAQLQSNYARGLPVDRQQPAGGGKALLAGHRRALCTGNRGGAESGAASARNRQQRAEKRKRPAVGLRGVARICVSLPSSAQEFSSPFTTLFVTTRARADSASAERERACKSSSPLRSGRLEGSPTRVLSCGLTPRELLKLLILQR
jgi:hypothetical protein